jgi:hypothetical protein
MIHFQTRLHYLILSSILLFTHISSANAFPQVADYPPRVIARPPGRVVQEESGGVSWVKFIKFINDHSLPLAVAGVGLSFLTGHESGLIYSVVVFILTCLCCSCCCCGRGSRIRNGGESDSDMEEKNEMVRRNLLHTAFLSPNWRRMFGRSNRLRNGNGNDSGCCIQ